MTRHAAPRRDASSPPPKPPAPVRSLQEEALDRLAAYLEGPLNRRAERILQSKIVLTPLALGWTAWARSYLAVRDGKISRLWRPPTADEAKRSRS